MRRLNVTHPQINLEDFIYYYHIAHKRKNIRALNQLCHLYPELSAMAFQNDSLSKRYDPSEYDYYRWHPITMRLYDGEAHHGYGGLSVFSG